MAKLYTMAIKHPFTTTIGAVLAVLYYIQGVGPVFPTDANGWGHLAIGALIGALGIVAADAKDAS